MSNNLTCDNPGCRRAPKTHWTNLAGSKTKPMCQTKPLVLTSDNLNLCDMGHYLASPRNTWQAGSSKQNGTDKFNFCSSRFAPVLMAAADGQDDDCQTVFVEDKETVPENPDVATIIGDEALTTTMKRWCPSTSAKGMMPMRWARQGWAVNFLSMI